MLKFLKSPPVLAITAIFLVQAGMLYSTVRTEVIPGARSLAEFPKQIGDARFLSEGVIDPEDRDLFWFAESARDIWGSILDWWEKAGAALL